MRTNINQILLKENSTAEFFFELLKQHEKSFDIEDAEVYYDYPIYSESSKLERSGFLIISKHYGVLLVKCLDHSERTLSSEKLQQILEDFEQTYSFLFAKLIKNKDLRVKVGILKVPLKPFLYLKSVSSFPKAESWEELNLFSDSHDFKRHLESIKQPVQIDEETLKSVIATLEGSSALKQESLRPNINSDKDSKGRILEKIESQIALFDRSQKRAALTIIDGPQRIRGLAGSGKTIILTMKAAQIHLTQPEARILYTYYTKNLYDFIKRLITRFYREFSDKDPDWSKINIMHSWGGESLEGAYSSICKENEIKPETFRENRSFSQVCENVLKSGKKLKEIFDYSIIDEGQDYPPSFYKICRASTKKNRIIWAYDECQNIFNMEIQDTVKTFGTNSDGKPYIDFSKDLQESQDLVLDKSYRTPRETLISAFALGLGIYGKKIIQMPENSAFWSDLGFKIEKGNYESGAEMEISLPLENVHKFKSSLLEGKNSLTYQGFNEFEEECNYIAQQIIVDLGEGLLPEDISVISLDDRAAKSYFKNITRILEKSGIKTFNLSDAFWNNQVYSLKDHVTLATVYKAKGNEAGSVYVLGVDSVYNHLDLNPITERNRLFAAMTRTKAWLTITGIGPAYKLFDSEIKKVSENGFNLIFKMPDFKELNLFKRDLAIKQTVMQEAKRQLEKVAETYGYDKDEFVQKHLSF